MYSKLVRLGIVVLLSLCTNSAAGQTIPESVRQLTAKGVQPPFVSRISRMLLDMDLERMSADADLIVTGTLTPKRTYLNPAETEVLTDYKILPTRVIHDRHPAERPTFGQGLTLTAEGGSMMVEGARVVVEDTQIELPVGKPLVLLLKKTRTAPTRS